MKTPFMLIPIQNLKKKKKLKGSYYLQIAQKTLKWRKNKDYKQNCFHFFYFFILYLNTSTKKKSKTNTFDSFNSLVIDAMIDFNKIFFLFF